MERFLGVKVERVARKYTEVLRIGKDRSGESRLTTLSPQQDLAEIDLYLLQQNFRDGSLRELKRLHRFTIGNTRKADGSRPLLSLKARKRWLRSYDVELSKDGRVVEQTTVKVPFRSGPILSVVALAIVLTAVLLALFTCNPGSPRSAGARSPSPEGTEQRDVLPIEKPATPEESSTSAETSGGSREESVPPPAPAEPSAPVPDEGEPEERKPEEPAETPREAPEEVTRSFTVYFHPDSSRLMEESRIVLDEIVSILTDDGTVIEDVVLEGHTALFGNEAGRERISSGRIEVVETRAREAGWSPDKPPVRRVLGASAPVTRVPENQNLNRRAEVTITYRQDGQ